jgi:hypothetical protein
MGIVTAVTIIGLVGLFLSGGNDRLQEAMSEQTLQAERRILTEFLKSECVITRNEGTEREAHSCVLFLNLSNGRIAQVTRIETGSSDGIPRIFALTHPFGQVEELPSGLVRRASEYRENPALYAGKASENLVELLEIWSLQGPSSDDDETQ